MTREEVHAVLMWHGLMPYIVTGVGTQVLGAADNEPVARRLVELEDRITGLKLELSARIEVEDEQALRAEVAKLSKVVEAAEKWKECDEAKREHMARPSPGSEEWRDESVQLAGVLALAGYQLRKALSTLDQAPPKGTER